MGGIEVKPNWVPHIEVPNGEDIIELQYNCEQCTYDWKVHIIVSPTVNIDPIVWG
jgi:hypothetical protein